MPTPFQSLPKSGLLLKNTPLWSKNAGTVVGVPGVPTLGLVCRVYRYTGYALRFRFFLLPGFVPVMYSVTTVLCFKRGPDGSPLYFILLAVLIGIVGVFPYEKPPYMLPVPRFPGHA